MKSDKAFLRAELIKRRKAVSPEERYEAGEAIARQLSKVVDWSRVKNVHIYRSLPELGEIDTQPVIDWILQRNPSIQIVVGESRPGAPFPESQFDVIFVPVVGFDRGCNRLGMGGGWYDRWLATQPHAVAIGLAYPWSEVQRIPIEQHDIQLTAIVS